MIPAPKMSGKVICKSYLYVTYSMRGQTRENDNGVGGQNPLNLKSLSLLLIAFLLKGPYIPQTIHWDGLTAPGIPGTRHKGTMRCVGDPFVALCWELIIRPLPNEARQG